MGIMMEPQKKASRGDGEAYQEETGTAAAADFGERTPCWTQQIHFHEEEVEGRSLTAMQKFYEDLWGLGEG